MHLKMNLNVQLSAKNEGLVANIIAILNVASLETHLSQKITPVN